MRDGKDAGPRGDQGSMPGTFAYLLIGPIVWALHLTSIYGAQTLCAVGVSAAAFGYGAISLFVVAATAAALVVLAAAIWRPHAAARLLHVSTRSGSVRQFLDRVMRLLAGLSVAGVALAGVTAFILPPCEQLR